MQPYSEPKNQEFHIAGITHLSVEDAYSLNENDQYLFLDVREEYELLLALVDVLHYDCCSMSEILDHVSKLPKDKAYILISNKGERSSKVVNLLKVQGFTEVYNLDGGIKAWSEAGLPMKSCSSEQCGSCSCGCS